jgi:purine-binding chemotaxis protein CheW
MSDESNTGYDIRAILNDMREEYWQGLSEAESAEKELLECVVLTLGGETFAFETLYAAEVIRIPKLIKVPKVKDIITGIFNLRGEITAAMDIRPLLELPQPPLTSQGRLVVVKSEQFITGILAESVLGVTGLSFDNFEPVIKSLSHSCQHFIRGQFNNDGSLIMLLDMAALLASSDIMVGTE